MKSYRCHVMDKVRLEQNVVYAEYCTNKMEPGTLILNVQEFACDFFFKAQFERENKLIISLKRNNVLLILMTGKGIQLMFVLLS